jgi:hypothetical protein
MSATGFAQVPSRSGYYIATSPTVAYASASNPGNSVRTVDISGGQVTGIAVGTLFRDMGKVVSIVNANGYTIDKYALVYIVSGGDSSEGAGYAGFATHYVRIFDHTSTGVTVARLG